MHLVLSRQRGPQRAASAATRGPHRAATEVRDVAHRVSARNHHQPGVFPFQATTHQSGLDRQIAAQYNPKEIQVDKSASWTPSPTGKGIQPELTFGSSNARTLTMELLFDTYEAGRDVHVTHVAALVALLDVIDPDARDEDKKRPPRVLLSWGDKLPPFIGVLESVTTKYTMFLPDGTPVRATCGVKLLEASRKSWRRGAR